MTEILPAEIAEAIDKALKDAFVHGLETGDGTGNEAQAERRSNSSRLVLDAVILKHLRSSHGTDVIVPWDFGGTDCLHPPGFEGECECFGCPRKAGR